MARRILRYALIAMLGITAVCGMYVFTSTLLPSARSDAALPRVETASISPKSYRFGPDLYDGYPKGEILFIRTAEGRLHAWFVPVQDGVRHLPDGPWWKLGLPCHSLRPDFGKGQISCEDADLPAWAKERYRWSLTGKRLSTQAEDMLAIPGIEEGGFVVFHKRRAAAT